MSTSNVAPADFTAGFERGRTVHRVVRSVATRFGKRYVTACGASGYNLQWFDLPVNCAKCAGKEH